MLAVPFYGLGYPAVLVDRYSLFERSLADCPTVVALGANDTLRG